AYDGSFAAGLLESMAQVVTGAPRVLLIAYDVDYPEPLNTARPIPDAFGVALVLSAGRGPRTLAQLQVETTAEPAETLAQPALEALRKTIPAARRLPLLAALAAGRERVVLDYLDHMRLAVRLAA
ncbi:MAG: beta-ketoacyl synthase chain length factor, partial [Zoogloea sp.]|nr:beta-ketoacyl synthase chain length factor [Zoogloea sp.]